MFTEKGYRVKLNSIKKYLPEQNSEAATGVVLKNFAKFTGKHLFWSLIFTKLQSLQASNGNKMRLQHRCFPVKFEKFLRTPILKNI